MIKAAAKCLTVLLVCLCSSLACGSPFLPGGDSGQNSASGQNIEECFHTVSHMAPGELAKLDGQVLTFAVNTDNSPGFSMDYDAANGTLTLLYRMPFNNITEGWSWEPQANPANEDYYRAKFLPLKSTWEEKTAAVAVEIHPGKKVMVSNRWRYDYFLAFENLYDFYPRTADDNAGFGGTVKTTELPARAQLKLLAIFRLKSPFHSESNTFWKADSANPVDLTLRKRYLIGQLVEIRFVDSVTGNVYLRQRPMNHPDSRQAE